MAWSASKIFSSYVTDVLNNTTAMDLNTDALLEVALFDNTITPSQTVASASSAYGAGVWAGGGQSSATSWPALGRPLASVTSTFSSNVYTFDAADTVSADSTATLSGTYGCLVYDKTITTPVSGQGICFNYFGGVNAVTSGQFTVVWNASGIFALTL
jgi:hypothetical protein